MSNPAIHETLEETDRSQPAQSGIQNLEIVDLAAERTCHFCGLELENVVLDLGMSPLCESFITADALDAMETFYPLRVFVCKQCYLMQLPRYESPQNIFKNYAYFSSFSESWLAHAKAYVEDITKLLQLTEASQVVEIASNDGYLLQFFVEMGIPALGIDPAGNVAEAARARGVDTLVEFFNTGLAERLRSDGLQADLIIGNNVLAQVPNLNSFVGGIKILLAPTGVATFEFPNLLRMIESNQFDTIYHEHFSYFSFSSAERIFAAHGLVFFDVDELQTHGGSLRIYARHIEDSTRPESARVSRMRQHEREIGLDSLEFYKTLQERVESTKRKLLTFLIDARQSGKRVVAYGAPGKGNTLLNYCGIRTDLIEYTVDLNPFKQGLFLPGTHIPIYPVERLAETVPDYIVILPWNLRDEIADQLAYTSRWGAELVVFIPEVEVLN